MIKQEDNSLEDRVLTECNRGESRKDLSRSIIIAESNRKNLERQWKTEST